MARRNSKRRDASAFSLPQVPCEQAINQFTPLEILTPEQLDKIHNASMRILEEIGLEIVNERTKALMLEHGATLCPKTGYVLMDRAMVMEKIKTVPSEFTLHARNAKYNRKIGANYINFTPVASAPNSSDLDRGRRTGNYQDFCNFVRLGQFFDCIDMFSGYPVEPVDLHASTRHLDAYSSFIKLSEKSWHVYSLGEGRVEDGIEMIKISRSIDDAQLKQEPSIMTVVNTNSPLKVDEPMLDGLMLLAEYNQPVIVTPFTLAGAMSPVSLAGALSQQNAEALGVIAITQMINPGAPGLYGGFTSNVDMKTGSPAFGTPEYAKAVMAGGQLARRYRIPYRTSGVNASNAVDAQATWEAQTSLWAATMSHGNMIKHSAGWLEGGLCASFEKFIIDIEMIQIMLQTLKGIEVNDEELAFDAIKEVGAGGHFFGTDHTFARYETAFHTPFVTDWSNFETWEENGSVTATQRANKIYKEVLEHYQQPHLDEAAEEELDAYVERRRKEYGVD